jgi:hypothetical protein
LWQARDMRQSPDRPRLRKREILFALTAGVVAAGGAMAILDTDGGGGNGLRSAANEPSEMTYQLANFERISTTGPQDLEITYGETFAVHADGAVSRLEVVVENGELVIRPRNGVGWDWADFDSTKVSVTMPRLTRVALTGSGEVSVDQVKGDRFSGVVQGFDGSIVVNGLEVDQAEFTINGPGEIVAAGTARATHMTINGPGEVQAGSVRSQTATINVNGPGDVELAVEQEADVSVQGPGEVDIDGPARCTISTSGPGSVSCGNQD